MSTATALPQPTIEATIRAARRPITQEAIAAAVAKDQTDWSRWSPNLRASFRWDVETTLTAEIKHGEADFIRILAKYGLRAMFDFGGPGPRPWELFWLPRERAACRALNALRHATVQDRLIREDVSVLRQRPNTGRYEDLYVRLGQRKQAWKRFLELFAAYQRAAS